MKKLLIAFGLTVLLLCVAAQSSNIRTVRITHTPTTTTDATYTLDPVTGHFIFVNGADAVHLRLMQTIRGALTLGDSTSYWLDSIQATVWGSKGEDSTAAYGWDSLWGFPVKVDSLGHAQWPLEKSLGDTSLAAAPSVKEIWPYDRFKVTFRHFIAGAWDNDSVYAISPKWILDMTFRY